MKGIVAVVILLTCPTGIYAQTQLSTAYPLPPLSVLYHH